MTASVATLREAIRAKLAAVAGMGVVNDYERYAKDQSKLLTEYSSSAQTGTRLYGWYIHRRKTSELLVSTGRNYENHDWKIRGFMSWDDADATVKKFDDQIEAMRDAFRADPTLGGICETQFGEMNGNQAGLQLEESAPVLFAGVLCHGATLGLITRVYTNT